MGNLTTISQSNHLVTDYEYEVDIGDGLSDIVPIPVMGGRVMSVTVDAGANTGTVYTTTALAADVATTTAWDKWSKGNVTGRENDTMTSKVNGIKFASISGAITCRINA